MPPPGARQKIETLGDPGAPGVLLLHSWWGVTPAISEWADHLVSAGRRVAVPDLFGGATPTDERQSEALAQAALNDDRTVFELERYADALAAEGGPWVAMGFSMGAFLACSLVGPAPDQLVLFYGGRPPAERDVRTRRVELHVAPADPWFEHGELADVAGGFRAAACEVLVHTYEGAGHWFAEAGSPGHEPAAAALARDRVLDRLRVPRS